MDLKRIVDTAFGNLVRKSLIVGLAVMVTTPDVRAEGFEEKFAELFKPAVGMAFRYKKFDVKESPAFYGDIPTHHGDSGYAVPVDLTGKKNGFASIGIFYEIAPIPGMSFFRVGYDIDINSDERNRIRNGISEIAWYQHETFGELEDYAATYTRVELPNVFHTFYCGMEMPMGDPNDENPVLLRFGVGHTSFNSKMIAGWDRWYHETPLIMEGFRIKGNIFSIGIEIPYDTGYISCFAEFPKLEGETPHGPVEIEGIYFGVSSQARGPAKKTR